MSEVMGRIVADLVIVASQAPILSMACSLDTQTIAVGTELQNHTASIHLW
jgi:hypothetical protein